MSDATKEQLEDVRRQLPLVSEQLEELALRTLQAQRLIRLVSVLVVFAALSVGAGLWSILQTREIRHDTSQTTNQISDCFVGTCATVREQRDALLNERAGIQSEIRRLTNEITIANARGDTVSVTERTKLRDQEVANLAELNARIARIADQIPRKVR